MDRRIAAAIGAAGMLLGGCSADEKRSDAPYLTCTVQDAEGIRYQARDLNGVEALQAAVDACTMNARNPTSCQEQGCMPSW